MCSAYIFCLLCIPPLVLINIHNTIQTNSPKVRSEENVVKVPRSWDCSCWAGCESLKKINFHFYCQRKTNCLITDCGTWAVNVEYCPCLYFIFQTSDTVLTEHNWSEYLTDWCPVQLHSNNVIWLLIWLAANTKCSVIPEQSIPNYWLRLKQYSVVRYFGWMVFMNIWK